MAKNQFKRASIKYYNYDETLQLLARVCKLLISVKVKEIPEFPEIKPLKPMSKGLPYDLDLLKTLVLEFDNYKSFSHDIIYRISKDLIGEKNLYKTTANRDLSKKRKAIERIIDDHLLFAQGKFKISSKLKKNSKYIYGNTVKIWKLSFPPKIINKIRFENLISKLPKSNADKLLKCYKLNNGYYSYGKRINKNNFQEISKIFFDLKHL